MTRAVGNAKMLRHDCLSEVAQHTLRIAILAPDPAVLLACRQPGKPRKTAEEREQEAREKNVAKQARALARKEAKLARCLPFL